MSKNSMIWKSHFLNELYSYSAMRTINPIPMVKADISFMPCHSEEAPSSNSGKTDTVAMYMNPPESM